MVMYLVHGFGWDYWKFNYNDVTLQPINFFIDTAFNYREYLIWENLVLYWECFVISTFSVLCWEGTIWDLCHSDI